MDDALVMRVLDGLADRDEELEPLYRRVRFWSQKSVMVAPGPAP